MSVIRVELINVAITRAIALIDYNIHNDIDKQHEFIQQTVLTDKSFTNDEKNEAIRKINKAVDKNKVLFNVGTRRICENCNQECLAISYCEYCVRNYLKLNFLNWTSGNNDIDNLIHKCQMETIRPNVVVEWIPHDNLQNIKYLTKGGFSEIYTAVWNDGRYDEWDTMKQQLTRFGNQSVVLKRLENIKSADQSWFEEAKSHFTISNKYPNIVPCYGLTQDPSNGNYMLVIDIMDLNLREYLQQNYNQLTWKRKIQFAYDITLALKYIHDENAIHRDLHSGNILFNEIDQRLFISDLGFCGPADKSSKSIYGNLPYIAPEVIAGKEYTFKSDIYSIAMLMWEISSGKPPFNNYEHDYYLAMNIINGIRPRIVSGTPLEYKNLMKQCWDADPLKRPDINTLRKKTKEIYIKYLNMPNELEENNNLEINKTDSLEESKETSSILFTSSKIHNFENFPEPRNATEEEQEAFHSKSYDDFYIPDSINDFAKSSSSKNNSISEKISSIFKVNSQKFSKMFKKLQIKNDSQEDYNNKETMKHHSCVDDEDEVHNNPNLHSEEQDELEIPDDI